MDLYQYLYELKLPASEYIVVGGSVLVVLGLINWDEDIDLAVTESAYASLGQRGWKQYNFLGKPVLKDGVYDVGVGFGEWNFNQLAEDAFTINDIRFMSPQKLLIWKEQANRPKDQAHINLLRRYLDQPG